MIALLIIGCIYLGFWVQHYQKEGGSPGVVFFSVHGVIAAIILIIVIADGSRGSGSSHYRGPSESEIKARNKKEREDKEFKALYDAAKEYDANH